MCKSIAVVILVVINTVFAAAGCLMLAFGIAAASNPAAVIKMLSYTADLTKLASDAGFSLVDIIQSSAVFLIVMGAIVAVVGLFGCVGACCRVKWMLGAYIIILVIVLLAEIALIIFAALFPEKFQSQAQPAMKATLMKFDSELEMTLQTELHGASNNGAPNSNQTLLAVNILILISLLTFGSN